MNTDIISVPRRVPAELNQGGTSTSLKVFQDSSGNPVVLPLPQSHILCGGNSAWNRKTANFRIVAIGRVTGGTTTNYTVTLYYGTSATAASDTSMAASTARAVDSANHNWKVEADLILDSTSQKIQGTATFIIAGIVNVHAAITIITGVDPTAVQTTASGGVNAGFVVAGTFSSGNAGNLAYLDSFVMISVA